MNQQLRGKSRCARAALLSALLTTGYEATAQDPDCGVIVTASGGSGDAAAIALAINSGYDSVVCLEGTFIFSDTDVVSIQPGIADIRIVGLDGATIRGGLQPFRFDSDPTLLSLKIDHIRFVQPRLTAVSIFDGNENGRIEISDLVIEGVRTAPLGGTSGPLIREGIAIVAPASDIAGEIVIKNNVVDAGPYIVGDEEIVASVGILASGLGVLGGTNEITAEISIIGNTITNWSGYGIQAIGVEDAIVRDNTIVPGSFANAAPTFGGCGANGIGLVNSIGAVVSNNDIHKVPALTGFGSPPTCSAGIILSSAFGNALGSRDNTFTKNRISGEGTHAVLLPNGSTVVDNVIFGSNNWSGFTPTDATIFLGDGAVDNIIWASGGTLAGPNVGDNIIRGASKRGGGRP